MRDQSRLVLVGALAGVASLVACAHAQQDDLIFIHHSCGSNWLYDGGLHDALVAKDYVDEVNEISYGSAVDPMTGRPDSLGEVDGDSTDMAHWVSWFNDYLTSIEAYGCATGRNRIIMFKSCYPNSNVESETGTDPWGWGDSGSYRAVYRHPDGPGNTYESEGYTYHPLEDIFAAHPEILFIPVTSPPLIPTETNPENAVRIRAFDNWLKNDWQAAYNAAHPTLHNVAVLDWFDFLAYPASYSGTEFYQPIGYASEGNYPVANMTKSNYRTGDSHPNTLANTESTAFFATRQGSFFDTSVQAWMKSPAAISGWMLR